MNYEDTREYLDDIRSMSMEKRVRISTDVAYTIESLSRLHNDLGVRQTNPAIKECYGANTASYIVKATTLLSDYQSLLLSSLCDEYDSKGKAV